MALETGITTFAQLRADWPEEGDSPAFGDDHIRLIKQVIVDNLSTIDKPFTKTTDELEDPFPIGMIMHWNGTAVSVPAGWKPCDGQFGTPDLRDRFIIGAGGAFDLGDTGGTTSHSHTASTSTAGSHSHAITVNGHKLSLEEMPAHTHEFEGTKRTQAIHGGDSRSYYTREGKNTKTTSTGGSQSHSHGASSASTGNHSHSATVNSKGGLRPPYYALLPIMKVS